MLFREAPRVDHSTYLVVFDQIWKRTLGVRRHMLRIGAPQMRWRMADSFLCPSQSPLLTNSALPMRH